MRGGRWEVGGGRWEVGGGRWEVGGGRWEVGGGRWEVGGGRWEVGGGRWEVGGGETYASSTSLFSLSQFSGVEVKNSSCDIRTCCEISQDLCPFQ